MSIDVTNLSFSYGSREILHDLSFSIPDGCLVNVLGPNGVGKSTLFRCILGLSPHYSGTILVNGKDLRALSVRERAREISYIPQSHAPVYDYEVVDVVLMATGNDLKMLATPGEAQLQRAHEALDYGNTMRVLSCVRQLAREGLSIVQSTHNPAHAFLYSDATMVLSEGGLKAFGDPREVITSELISELYDLEVEVNSLYGDKVRVCVPVREIERQ